MGGFDKAIKTCGEYIKPVKQATLRLKELEQSVKQRKHELKVKEEEEKHAAQMENTNIGPGRRWKPSKAMLNKATSLKHNLSDINESNEHNEAIYSKTRMKQGIKEDLIKLKQARSQVQNLTQFYKVHCHPMTATKKQLDQSREEQKSFSQIASEASERMNTKPRQQSDYHPYYDAERDSEFTKELYRLKGFAYLRTQEKQHELTLDARNKFSQNELVMQDMSVVKAATCFQKALGNDSKDFQ